MFKCIFNLIKMLLVTGLVDGLYVCACSRLTNKKRILFGSVYGKKTVATAESLQFKVVLE